MRDTGYQRVIDYVAAHIAEHGRCACSAEEIAAACYISPRSVQKYLVWCYRSGLFAWANANSNRVITAGINHDLIWSRGH